MKLTKISARNLKGLSFSLDLATIQFLIGSNFAGKSARTDAIRLLLIGYLPELGKLPRATFGICSGRELVVTGTFDDGTTATRRWFLKGDSVKTEADLPDWLRAEEQMTVMLDAATYFAKSDRDRITYVFENIAGLTGEGPRKTRAELVAKLTAPKEDEEPLGADNIRAFMGELGDYTAAEEREVNFSGWTPQCFIEAALAFTRERESSTRARKDMFGDTARGLAYLRAVEAPGMELAKLDAQIEAQSQVLEKVRESKAQLYAAARINEGFRERRKRLTSDLAGRGSFTKIRDERSGRMEVLRAHLASLVAVEQSEIDAPTQEDRQLAIKMTAVECKLQIASAGNQKLEKEQDEIEAKTSCPYCGASGSGWKELKRMELSAALEAGRKKIAELKAEYGEYRAESATLARQLQTLRGRATEYRQTQAELTTALASLAEAEKAVAAFAGKEAELAAIPPEDAELADKCAQISCKFDAEQENLGRWEAERKLVIGRANDLKRLAEAEKASADSAMDYRVAKAAAEALRDIQADMVARALQPLLVSANLFCGPILKSPLAYHEGEIGSWRDGAWVGHKTFSGTEKALCYAAIQAALSARSPLRIMLIDELGRLDDEKAGRLVESVCGSIAGQKFDQFVGIDTDRATMYGRSEPAGLSLQVLEIE